MNPDLIRDLSLWEQVYTRDITYHFGIPVGFRPGVLTGERDFHPETQRTEYRFRRVHEEKVKRFVEKVQAMQRRALYPEQPW